MPHETQQFDYTEYGKSFLSGGRASEWRELAATRTLTRQGKQLYSDLRLSPALGRASNPQTFVDQLGNFSVGMLTFSRYVSMEQSFFVAVQIRNESERAHLDAPGSTPQAGRPFQQVRFTRIYHRDLHDLYARKLTPLTALLHQHAQQTQGDGQSTVIHRLRDYQGREAAQPDVTIHAAINDPYPLYAAQNDSRFLWQDTQQDPTRVNLIAELFMAYLTQPRKQIVVYNTPGYSLLERLHICEVLQYLLSPLQQVLTFALDYFTRHSVNLLFVKPQDRGFHRSSNQTIIDPRKIEATHADHINFRRMLATIFDADNWEQGHQWWQQHAPHLASNTTITQLYYERYPPQNSVQVADLLRTQFDRFNDKAVLQWLDTYAQTPYQSDRLVLQGLQSDDARWRDLTLRFLAHAETRFINFWQYATLVELDLQEFLAYWSNNQIETAPSVVELRQLDKENPDSLDVLLTHAHEINFASGDQSLTYAASLLTVWDDVSDLVTPRTADSEAVWQSFMIAAAQQHSPVFYELLSQYQGRAVEHGELLEQVFADQTLRQNLFEGGHYQQLQVDTLLHLLQTQLEAFAQDNPAYLQHARQQAIQAWEQNPQKLTAPVAYNFARISWMIPHKALLSVPLAQASFARWKHFARRDQQVAKDEALSLAQHLAYFEVPLLWQRRTEFETGEQTKWEQSLDLEDELYHAFYRLLQAEPKSLNESVQLIIWEAQRPAAFMLVLRRILEAKAELALQAADIAQYLQLSGQALAENIALFLAHPKQYLSAVAVWRAVQNPALVNESLAILLQFLLREQTPQAAQRALAALYQAYEQSPQWQTLRASIRQQLQQQREAKAVAHYQQLITHLDEVNKLGIIESQDVLFILSYAVAQALRDDTAGDDRLMQVARQLYQYYISDPQIPNRWRELLLLYYDRTGDEQLPEPPFVEAFSEQARQLQDTQQIQIPGRLTAWLAKSETAAVRSSRHVRRSARVPVSAPQSTSSTVPVPASEIRTFDPDALLAAEAGMTAIEDESQRSTANIRSLMGAYWPVIVLILLIIILGTLWVLLAFTPTFDCALQVLLHRCL